MKYIFLNAILVTTEEALEQCYQDGPTVFCIEGPLFSELSHAALQDPRIADYEIHIHEASRYMLFLRVVEPRPFDKTLHRFIYHPITYT